MFLRFFLGKKKYVLYCALEPFWRNTKKIMILVKNGIFPIFFKFYIAVVTKIVFWPITTTSTVLRFSTCRLNIGVYSMTGHVTVKSNSLSKSQKHFNSTFVQFTIFDFAIFQITWPFVTLKVPGTFFDSFLCFRLSRLSKCCQRL